MQRKTQVNTKIIGTASEMSNLVKMYAVFIKNGKLLARIYICGKADNKYFICQSISPLDGYANVAKLMTLDELKDWIIIPDIEIYEEAMKDYFLHKTWRYNFPKID